MFSLGTSFPFIHLMVRLIVLSTPHFDRRTFFAQCQPQDARACKRTIYISANQPRFSNASRSFGVGVQFLQFAGRSKTDGWRGCMLFCGCHHDSVRMAVLMRRDTIRFSREKPGDCPVHRPIVKCGMSLECSGPMNIG